MTGSHANENRAERQCQEEKRNEEGDFLNSFIAIRRVSFFPPVENPASYPIFMALYSLAVTPIAPTGA